MDENNSIARFESHVRILIALVLFGLSIYSFVTLPAALKQLVLSRKEQLDKPKDLHAVEVTANGSPVGWLLITYKDVMRGDEESAFEVRYSTQGSFWSRNPPQNSGMSVSISANGLSILPVPMTYTFNGQRLAFFRDDNHIWTVSAKKDGDFLVAVRFSVPRGLILKPIEVNGRPLDAVTAELTLPVKVYTPFEFWNLAGNCAKYMGTIIAFLLSLPLASILLTWYLKRKQKESRPRATDQAVT